MQAHGKDMYVEEVFNLLRKGASFFGCDFLYKKSISSDSKTTIPFLPSSSQNRGFIPYISVRA